MRENCLIKRSPDAAMIRTQNEGRKTVGMDLGDRWSQYCAVGSDGEVIAEDRVRTTPGGMEARFSSMAATRIVIETGTHSPCGNGDSLNCAIFCFAARPHRQRSLGGPAPAQSYIRSTIRKNNSRSSDCPPFVRLSSFVPLFWPVWRPSPSSLAFSFPLYRRNDCCLTNYFVL